MKINLDDKFFIKNDGRSSYILFEKVESKSGVERDEALNYHATVEQAVKKYIKIKSTDNTSENATLKDYLDQQKALYDKFEKLLKGEY